VGFLRFYLAFCVISSHVAVPFGFPVLGGDQAVECFFLISGFYMAEIHDRKVPVGEFWVSRFLRIFVPFWVVLATTVALAVAGGLVSHRWGCLAPWLRDPFPNGFAGAFLATMSNVTLLFQDWMLFLSHPAGAAISFSRGFWNEAAPLKDYLILPQAWSLALEVQFYLLVPWLLRRRDAVLVAILCVSIGARVAAALWLGLDHDPWTYRFFPFELALFLTGVLAHHRSEGGRRWRIPGGSRANLRVSLSAFATIVAVCGLAAFVGHRLADGVLKVILMLLPWPAVAAAISVLFQATRDHRLDRRLGDLSYPLYLVHLLALSLLVHVDVSWSRPLPVLALSTVLALVLQRTVVDPLESRRKVWARRLGGRDRRNP